MLRRSFAAWGPTAANAAYAGVAAAIRFVTPRQIGRTTVPSIVAGIGEPCGKAGNLPVVLLKNC
jgi:hypothetical protein